MSERNDWLYPHLEARLWWCEDEECDCTQPQIDRITPNTEMFAQLIR